MTNVITVTATTTARSCHQRKPSFVTFQNPQSQLPNFNPMADQPVSSSPICKQQMPSASVKSISEVLRQRLSPRIIGFDDTPFQSRPRAPGTLLNAVGVVTSADRFEGMLYCNEIIQDGLNAGNVLSNAVRDSKFHDQIHAVLLDGITMGGLNIIDIALLAEEIQRPVVAVMRARPNLDKMRGAIAKVADDESERLRRLDAAGEIYEIDKWVFQCKFPSNVEPEDPRNIAMLLQRCTPTGTQKIPEALRIAHLIGAAIKTGQSSSSA